MNEYEYLQNEAYEDGVEVIDYKFKSKRINRLYCDGTVAIRKDLNSIAKACTLAEELGHHHTSVGNIPDLSEALHEAVECYRDKYGICTSVDNYTIYFIPRLTVMKRI